MTDWATEIADKLCNPDNGLAVYDVWTVDDKAVAAALRKAKADGMREANLVLEDCGNCDATDHIIEIREMADKLDPPTT